MEKQYENDIETINNTKLVNEKIRYKLYRFKKGQVGQ